MNEGNDKKKVAIEKILKHHEEFDMQPLFEWEFKALPSVIGFFNRAAACVEEEDTVDIKRRKLSAIYHFVRGMPVLYVEAQTRRELEEAKAKKMELWRKQMKLKQEQLKLEREQMSLSLEMEEVEACVTRIKRRLC